MNIIEARKLQRQLSKCSYAENHCGTCFHHITEKLCYYVSHKITDSVSFFEMNDKLLMAINERIKFGVQISIKINSPYIESIYPNSKRYGIFVLEIIEID